MEQNKLENQFKEKLNNRNITPSFNSWDRLDVMLSVQEKSKPKSSFKWIYIAASLILFVSIGYKFITQSSKIIIEQNSNVVIEENSIIKDIPVEVYKSVSEEEVLKSNLIQFKASVKKIAITTKEQNIINPIVLENIKVETKDILGANYVDSESVLLEAQSAINSKVVIAITSSKNKIEVDPKVLLNEIETNLNATFREKAINNISKNYNSIKSAVVNRNYQ